MSVNIAESVRYVNYTIQFVDFGKNEETLFGPRILWDSMKRVQFFLQQFIQQNEAVYSRM